MDPRDGKVSRERIRLEERLEQWGRDVRHALRGVARMPSLALVVVLSLGVGIGVNTAVFSWLQAMVMRPLPGVEDADEFLTVEPRAASGSFPGASWLEYRDLRERLGAFRDLMAFRMVPLNLGADTPDGSGSPGGPGIPDGPGIPGRPGKPDGRERGPAGAERTERVFGQLVSGNYFAVLGLAPTLGRFLRPDEVERPGGEPVVVISHDLWRTRFGASEAAVGRRLRINGREMTVVGVTPEGFQGTVLMLDFDLWVPATMAPALLPGSAELEDRGTRGYTVMGRLRAGATEARARGELEAAMAELGRLHPEAGLGLTGEIRAFWRAPRGPQQMLALAMAVLQAILLLLLLAVCGNTANLLLARSWSRQSEMGIRLALGAGRWRVVRLVLVESLVLAILGTAVGALAAVWGSEALRAVPLTGAFPIRFQTGVDGGTLAFALALGVGSGLVFGLAPAVQLARVGTRQALHVGDAGVTERGGLRDVLMGTQVALALVVLAVAAMFLESFREARDTDPGFRREGVLLAAYDLGGRGLDAAASRRFAADVLDGLRALPAVEAAAISVWVPLDIHGMPSRTFTLEGRARADGAPDRALTSVVTPGYFRTLEIPLLSGTDFADLDDDAAPAEAVVNEAFVRTYVESGEPIGRRLRSGGQDFRIVGVVADSLYESFSEPPTPMVYLSYRDRPVGSGEIHVRSAAGTGAGSVLAPAVRRVVEGIEPTLPVYDVRTLDQHVERNLVLRRIPARMFAVLGPLLLLLAAIGIYAVVAHTVARRTAEIGLRRALGATAGRVQAQIVLEGMYTVVLGALAGWLVAFTIARAPMLRADPWLVLAGVPALLLAVAALACWLPARRASRVDPLVALRQE